MIERGVLWWNLSHVPCQTKMTESHNVTTNPQRGVRIAGEVTVCTHPTRQHSYCFDRSAGTLLCLSCAVLYRPVLRRTILMALLIGSLLTLINQGDVLLHGHFAWFTTVKIGLTYLVPFGVSTSSALAANRMGCAVEKRTSFGVSAVHPTVHPGRHAIEITPSRVPPPGSAQNDLRD